MSPLGLFHTAMGVIALISGLLVYLKPQGTATHRRIGYVYVLSMVLLNVTALMIYRLFGGFGPFHVLAIISLITLLRGIVPAYRKRPAGQWLTQHYLGMSWSYVGLWAATAAEIASRGPWVTGRGPAFGISVFVASAVIIAIGAIVINRKQADILRRVMGNLKR
ncbi:MAG: DUF2306 domain-containing protein [Anaerolineae bacterium]|nr:DUF2306 domain-containing protein [Anaerolineae bacterium]